MARKKLKVTLPPLPKQPQFKSSDHKSARLLEVLRGVAIANQREQPRTFHPLREVARHFRLPISTVARVYRQLEDEGLLVSVRGSKTLLQGLSSGRHFSVLGFIGLPAALSAFVTLQDYRNFFIRTRRELRARGFAVAMVLFEPKQIQNGRLAERIMKHDFDTVLWYRPEVAARRVLAALEDTGIEVIGVNDGGIAAVRCRYEVQRERAVREILRDWRRTGIESAVIVRASSGSAAHEEMLQTLLEEEDLPSQFHEIGSGHPGRFVESLGAISRVGLIFQGRAAALLAFRAPEMLTQLMRQTRIAFTGGPPSFVFSSVPDVPGDIVAVDWQLIAEQLVNDLISRKAFDRKQTTVFEADTHLQSSLSQHAQGL